MTQRKMRLGLFFEGLGHHIAAWRDPKVDPTQRQAFAHFAQIAQTAERGLFDLVFTADTFAMFGPNDPAIWSRTTRMSRHEPLTLLAALAAVTQNIGLVATASTSFYEPFHIARFFASLDQISGGRGGWNLVTSSSTTEAANFGMTLPEEKERYVRATEFAAVVKGLWDSWDEDAVIGDKEAGIFIRPDGVHLLEHKGEHYSVRGPLTLPSSPQGRPVIVQAGQSNEGRTLASAVADIVFSVEQNVESAKAYYDDIKRRAVAAAAPRTTSRCCRAAASSSAKRAPKPKTSWTVCSVSFPKISASGCFRIDRRRPFHLSARWPAASVRYRAQCRPSQGDRGLRGARKHEHPAGLPAPRRHAQSSHRARYAGRGRGRS